LIGIFDSGVGGFCAYRELRRLLPKENILYLADRKNAPYGTKTKDEIIALTRADIGRLRSFGAEKILIACCTASSIHSDLPDKDREISLPIITPAARAAARLGSRIAIIATEHTARSSAFGREISAFSDAPCFEFAEQKLVSLVEGGSRDGRVSDECRKVLLSVREKVRGVKADLLILGCTHFSHLEGEISRLLPGVKIISPAREGARELAKAVKGRSAEAGRITYM
jgi:glutamate racemase